MKPDSLRLDDDALARLVAGGESARVEFKERLEGDARLRIEEAVCAFANDLAGFGKPGLVIVGLRDDGSAAGIEASDDLLLSLAGIRTEGNVLPPPMLLAEKRALDGIEVAVLAVAPSDSPPVRCRGRIHVRNGPRRSIATAQEERILNERRQFADRPYDLRPISSAAISDLHRRRFEDEYLPNAVAPDVLAANDRSYEQRLAATKMIASTDDERPTVLGLLVLGKQPRDFIGGSWVQFLRIDGGELSDEIVDAETIDGPVADMVRRLEDKLRSHNRCRVDIVGADRERQSHLYPPAALQQFFRNAVMHRTYEGTNAPVRVTWFNDRIEIQSPGGPYGNVTVENFGRPGVADYRNPNLAEAMRSEGHVQRFGVGIGMAQRLLREAGQPEARFRVDSTHVLVTLDKASWAPEAGRTSGR